MASETAKRIGARIRERREELKRADSSWTQDGLARRVGGGTAYSMVSRWERGLHEPRRETLERIADLMDVDVAYFLAAASPTAASREDDDGYASRRDIESLRALAERIDAKLDRLLSRRQDEDAAMTPNEAAAALARLAADGERVLQAAQRRGRSGNRP